MALEITNFSIDVGGWGYANSGISVDITDLTYSVTSSGTYMEVDGTTVSATLTTISGGYRLYYDPDDDFSSIGGSTAFTVYGSNDNNENVMQEHYVTYGYIVELENSRSWDFGLGQQILVRVSAENNSICPVQNAGAFIFETVDFIPKELGATIVGIPAAEEEIKQNNLSAEIYPQSTAFFYEKIYKVVITTKDFAGNEMEPLEFEFKIEDKPE